MPDTFAYLATPYSKYPGGLEAAYREACRAANLVREMRARIRVYCPIETSHPIAMSLRIDPLDHAFWMSVCRPFMERADRLIVVKMMGWQDSRGIAEEIQAFEAMGKPIEYLDWPLG